MKWIAASLITAGLVQILCQTWKLVFYSLRDKRFSFSYFTTAGGMPSSHSAFVTALCISIGWSSGFSSDVFTVAFVFGAIVIYDAYRLRGTVETHSKTINLLIRKYHPEEKIILREMVGHTPLEIIVGIIIGIMLSTLLYFYLIPLILQ